MAMFDDSLERVWLELLNRWVGAKRTGDKATEDLAWDLMADMERMWPDKVAAIKDRYGDSP